MDCHSDAKSIILIPARFASTRYPGKPLEKINGKTLIRSVYENMLETKIPCYVVTDDERIEKEVQHFGGSVIRVDDDVPSGSDRIYLAYNRYFKKEKIDLILNIQGDEPLLKAQEVLKLRDFHLSSKFDLATMVRARKKEEDDFHSPNVVKALFSETNGQCLYFSRSQVPHGKEETWFQHIGVYSYRPNALGAFIEKGPTPLEKSERLEQLRALEIGLTIGAIKIEKILVGVDTPDDLKKVEGVL